MEVNVLLMFCLIILTANVIQGITGFAGTLIAMPFLIMIIDLETSRQVLNLLGIVASLWIVKKDNSFIHWKQVQKIWCYMMIGLVVGLFSYSYIPQNILLLLLSLFVLYVGIKGVVISLFPTGNDKKITSDCSQLMLLVGAGIIHGLFVSGGPLLVAYMTKNVDDKREFRATLSTVWIGLNTIILIQSLITGMITTSMTGYMLLAIVPLFMGILLGDALLKQMSQKVFMLLAYGLLVFSGISLLL